MARTEVRKECPSCGLGVPLDEKVCEFCGWNFDEEDDWIEQIDKLEEELITEKQKFGDNSVDKMIKSTLRKTDDKEGEVALGDSLAAQPVRMKKIISKPPQTKPSETKSLDLEIKSEPVQSSSGPIVSKPKAFRIDVAKMAAPNEPDQELEIADAKRASPTETKEAAPQPAATQEKPAATESPAAVQPTPAVKKEGQATEQAPPQATGAPAAQGKVVRRVVKHDGQPKPMMATGEARKAVAPKPTVPAAAPPKPAPEKPKPPVAAAKPTPPPAKEEKKSRFSFGKRLSHEKEHSAPEKIHQAPHKEPAKQTIKVFVCPLCNAEVLETQSKCPGCGAEFE
jgi:hypothetical protein